VSHSAFPFQSFITTSLRFLGVRARRFSAVCCALLGAVILSACATTDPSPQPSRYDVRITRTDFGVPHVEAADLGSLAYGIGYAYAQDNFCILGEKINQLNGERSRYFGPETPVHLATSLTTSSRESDFFHRLFSKESIAEQYRRGSAETVEMTEGYAAGVNRYLRDTGVDNLPTACRGAAWVRPVTDEDLYLWYTAVAMLASGQRMLEAIVAAQPPERTGHRSEGGEGGPASGEPLDLLAAGEALARPSVSGLGSNAWAFGGAATSNGRGLLFGNPHWSWGNIHQFYQAHLTIPGSLDVMGVTYGGMPGIVIGFNRSVAWSHTVSTGARFVFRELTLASDSATAYMVDGERHEMQPVTVTIDVLGGDGVVRPESRTLYSSRFGPVVVRNGMPWNETTAYAFTDMNLPNFRMMEQWMEIGRAESVGEIRTALASVMGIPWVNTIAADAEGRALYADYSVKPYVTDEMLEECGGSQVARRLTEAGLVTLDGSTSSCDPLSDPTVPQRGILPPRLLPILERSDYVANSNNSYWLTNPAAPITGLPIINGRADTFIGFRPQSGLRTIEARLAGVDTLAGNRFDAGAIKAVVFGHPEHSTLGNHNRTAEVVLEALPAICGDDPTITMADGTVVDATAGCSVLAAWDRRHAAGSVGAHLFRELWADAARIPRLWRVPFDPESPFDTPRDPDVENAQVREALRQALGAAIVKLGVLGIPLDRPWGEVHWHPLGDQRIPLAGNPDILNMIITRPLTAEGYREVLHGTSYVQIVGFDPEGPVADAVLLFGQSTDPSSPHYHDQLRDLWTRGEWQRLPFHRSDVEARAVSRLHLEE
jgi:acyl-homoserine-lactone acylase